MTDANSLSSYTQLDHLKLHQRVLKVYEKAEAPLTDRQVEKLMKRRATPTITELFYQGKLRKKDNIYDKSTNRTVRRLVVDSDRNRRYRVVVKPFTSELIQDVFADNKIEAKNIGRHLWSKDYRLLVKIYLLGHKNQQGKWITLPEPKLVFRKSYVKSE